MLCFLLFIMFIFLFLALVINLNQVSSVLQLMQGPVSSLGQNVMLEVSTVLSHLIGRLAFNRIRFLASWRWMRLMPDIMYCSYFMNIALIVR